MAFSANVLEVMIASPGDVNDERKAVVSALSDWNNLNTIEKKVVLLPVAWETHAAPDLAGRPQGMINKRLLETCDLLIGIFWTRLGSPTGEDESGTVEEIKKHVAAKKPAMVYFSTQPVAPSSIDPQQYGKVQEFKRWCHEKGITHDFENVDVFQKNLAHHLTIIFRQNAHLKSILEQVDAYEIREPNGNETVLGEKATEILVLAADSETGEIMRLAASGGPMVSAGGNVIEHNQKPREIARIEAAIDELETCGLIRDRGYKREIYDVTEAGYQAVEKARSDAG